MGAETRSSSCGPKELGKDDVLLKCSGDCDLRSLKSLSSLIGLSGSPSREINGLPLVDVIEAAHNSIVHEDYKGIDEMFFDRTDPVFVKLRDAIFNGDDICPEKVSLN